LYKEKRRLGFASKKPSLKESRILLLKLVQEYSSTTLILDALDESNENCRGDLLEVFNYLIKNSDQLKIFVSSRSDTDISRQLRKEANVGVGATDNQNDIAKFVLERIEKTQRRRAADGVSLLSENLSAPKNVQTVLDKSQGM
jgi:hypothetical protein